MPVTIHNATSIIDEIIADFGTMDARQNVKHIRRLGTNDTTARIEVVTTDGKHFTVTVEQRAASFDREKAPRP